MAEIFWCRSCRLMEWVALLYCFSG